MAESKDDAIDETEGGAAWMDPGNDEAHKRSVSDLEEGDPLLAEATDQSAKDYGSSAPPQRTEQGFDAKTKNGAAQKIVQTSRPHIPNQNPILWLIHFINGAAVIASLCLILTQVVPYLANPAHQTETFFLFLNFILKFYIVLFCVLFLMVEIDVPLPFTRNSPMLQRFASRGFLYSFIGLISTVESYSDRVQSFLEKSTNDQITWAAIFMQVSAWLMLAIGLIYMLMGVCCLQVVIGRMKEHERQQWRDYRLKMKEWKRYQRTMRV